jgi:uncharacterized protein YqgC (DUF456 family)
MNTQKKEYPEPLFMIACVHLLNFSFQLYLQVRFFIKFSILFKPLLQIMALGLAYYFSLSRISDYKHHWSDCLAGSLLGIAFAFYTVSILLINKCELLLVSEKFNYKIGTFGFDLCYLTITSYNM